MKALLKNQNLAAGSENAVSGIYEDNTVRDFVNKHSSLNPDNAFNSFNSFCDCGFLCLQETSTKRMEVLVFIG